MGSIYKPKLWDRKNNKPAEESAVWWISYYANGKRTRESSGTEIKRQAEDLLKEREGRVVTGQPILPRADRITVGELAADLKREYETNARRSVERLEDSLGHLNPFFASRRAQQLTTADVIAYVAERQGENAANATINRELAALKRMYTLAVQGGKLHRRPHIPMLKEDNVRQGFFERDQFEAVRKHLPDYAQSVVTFAYITGWRIKSEVLTLQWRQVDFKAGKTGIVRLEPGTTKNRDGRTFILTPELRACLEAQRAATDALQKEQGKIIPWVFHRRKGVPFASFRKAWLTACKAAGTPGRIPHDFRRTAVRNLERAGVPRSVAMKMVGHKTESVYRRYAIVDEAMLREGSERLSRLDAAGV